MPARGVEHVESDPFVVGARTFRSRLLVGTGKFASHALMRAAVLASGAEIVTVALRRVDLGRLGEGDILDFVPPGVALLPNTSGAVDADEAVRLAPLGRAGPRGGLAQPQVTPGPPPAPP